MKMTKVMKMLTILSMRDALYREMSVFSVFAASSGVRKYFCSPWSGSPQSCSIRGSRSPAEGLAAG